jgi:hypothetical protein
MQTFKFSTLFFTITALALAAGLAGAPTLPAAMACQVFGLVCLAARD